MLRIGQQLAAGLQLVVLAFTEVGALQLGNLIPQHIHAACFFRIVHGELLHFLHGFLISGIGRAILGKRAVRARKRIQIADVRGIVEQLLAVVLAVDIDKPGRRAAQHGRRGGPSAHAAGPASVRGNVALDQQTAILVRRHAKFCQRRKRLRREVAEKRRHRSARCARAHQVAAGPRTQHRTDGVHHNRLARAGFAGQNVKALVEFDIRGFHDRYVFNMKR